jgi:hypothetical protein
MKHGVLFMVKKLQIWCQFKQRGSVWQIKSSQNLFLSYNIFLKKVTTTIITATATPPPTTITILLPEYYYTTATATTTTSTTIITTAKVLHARRLVQSEAKSN